MKYTYFFGRGFDSRVPFACKSLFNICINNHLEPVILAAIIRCLTVCGSPAATIDNHN